LPEVRLTDPDDQVVELRLAEDTGADDRRPERPDVQLVPLRLRRTPTHDRKPPGGRDVGQPGLGEAARQRPAAVDVKPGKSRDRGP